MSSMVVITAAGGNGTAIEIIDDPLTRMEYSSRGRLLGENAEKLGTEQAGFIVLSQGHFEMAGGEFCGNASRAAAVLFSELRNARDVSFTVSGFKGVVHATVDKRADGKYSVYCRFPGMSVDVRPAKSRGRTVDVVDLGGIVHVVIEDKFPAQQDTHQEIHHRLTEELNLRERDAVGVVWVERKGDSVEIHPVVG